MNINGLEIDVNRPVGAESRKTFKQKLESGFFERYMSGNGLSIGDRGYVEGTVSILPDAISVNLGDNNYDGNTLPYNDNSQSYVHTSHVLEHINDYIQAIREWYRVLKVGGCLVITVPHRDLYERKLSLPSKWNGDHRRYYRASDLIREIEESLEINSYRIRHFEETDIGYDYSIPLDKHPAGCLECLVVIEKIIPPIWKVA